jgi:hypothetical protein
MQLSFYPTADPQSVLEASRFSKFSPTVGLLALPLGMTVADSRLTSVAHIGDRFHGYDPFFRFNFQSCVEEGKDLGPDDCRNLQGP